MKRQIVIKKQIVQKLESYLKVVLLSVVFLTCLFGGQITQAAPTIIVSVDKGYYGIGEYTTYSITGAQPNSPIYWDSWKDGVAAEVNAFYGHYTDSSGNWSATASSGWTAAWVGFWKKKANIVGKSSFATFYVVPTLTTNLNVYQVGTYTTYSITGAQPNSPIYWDSWQNGVAAEVNAFYGHYTDSSGNWSATASSAWVPAWVGFWKKKAKIGSTSNFGTCVEFLVVDQLSVNKSSYLVGEYATYSITGAPPNSPIYWTSWKDGVSTGEVNAFYGQYTSSSGNWSLTASTYWIPVWVGLWKKQATVGGWTKSVTFIVKPKALSSENNFTKKVSSYLWGNGDGTLSDGGSLVGGLGARSLHMLFNARRDCNPNTSKRPDGSSCDPNANPFIDLAQTPDIVKQFSDPRINTYLLTIFGGRSQQSVAYIQSGGQPFKKQFYSPDLFNSAISPLPNYRNSIINEMSEFVQYLMQTYRGTGKRFILSNWEADNVARGGSAFYYAATDQEGTRFAPLKICNNAVTPTQNKNGELISYTSSCADQSQGVLAKACAVGPYPDEQSWFVRQYEACPTGWTRSVSPFSFGPNGGWIPQDPNDTAHNPKWSYKFRDWTDGVAAPEFHFQKYDGTVGTSEDAIDGFRRVFDARQEGVRQGRDAATNSGWGGVSVYHAPEFNVIHLLKDQGFKNLVNDALPIIDFDFVSYSAYDTTNNSLLNPGPSPSINQAKITGDLDLASSLLAPSYVNGGGRFRNIIIGEFAFDLCQASTSSGATSIYGTVLDTATNWGVPYAFNWEIFEVLVCGGGWRGLYVSPTNLTRLPLGDYYLQRYSAP